LSGAKEARRRILIPSSASAAEALDWPQAHRRLSGKQTSPKFSASIFCGTELFLICLPTTAGTGAEVSPNAVLLDGPMG
jgi:alcohol dehydrogenase class IV